MLRRLGKFYMSCYQVTVTAGGSASPPTVRFPGAYSATYAMFVNYPPFNSDDSTLCSDPGILDDIYSSDNTKYQVCSTPPEVRMVYLLISQSVDSWTCCLWWDDRRTHHHYRHDHHNHHNHNQDHDKPNDFAYERYGCTLRPMRWNWASASLI